MTRHQNVPLPRGVPRRTVMTAASAGMIGALAMCGDVDEPTRKAGLERGVNFGLENIVADDLDLRSMRRRLDACNASALSLAIGRVEWAGFPRADLTYVANRVKNTGTDFVAEAIKRLRGERTLTLVIDTLAPTLLAEHPELAGRDPDGNASEEFPGVAAIESGKVGDMLVDLTAEACERYRPDYVSFTELMFDDHTFSEPDLESFREFSGEEGFPRNADGGIDTEAAALGEWRTAVLAGLLARVKKVAEPHGVKVEMDVRAPLSDPDGDRAMSGHGYEQLLESADRLCVWNYYGLSSRRSNDGIEADGADFGAQLSRSLSRRFGDRFVMSTGLWADHGTMTPTRLDKGLRALEDAKSPAVSVTPVSLMSEAHWEVLEQRWAG